MGSIVCTSFVHDCIPLFSFVHLLLFFLSRGVGLGTCYPPFLILDSKMESIVCISFVQDYIQLFSFVHLILFFLSWGRGGWVHATLFWFWIRKWAQSFVLRLYMIVCVSFRLYISYFSSSPRWAGDMLFPFSDFGFDSGLNRLYFLCTWLYTSFFVCTPYTFLPSLGVGVGAGDMLHFFDFGFENGFNRLYFVCTLLYTSFSVYIF